MTYLHARTHYGVVDPTALSALKLIWEHVLGPADVRALDALYARVIWIADSEIAPLSDAARRYRDVVGPADEPPSASGADDRRSGEGAGSGGGDRIDSDSRQPNSDAAGASKDANGQGGPRAGSLADALEQALAATRAGVLAQLDEDVRLADVIARAANAPLKARPARRHGTGAPSGRIPDRGVDRPPFPDERLQARRYAQRLAQAITAGTRETDKRTPGGRFDGRAHARGQAQRAAGRPVSTHPWRVIRHIRAPIEEPHVALIIDTSGSMSGYEPALGPIAWVLHEGLRSFGGRLAVALFGNGAELLSDGTRRLDRVPGIRTGGGTAFAGDALELATDRLEMTNPRRPRFIYVLSDGAWYDTRAGVERIRWLSGHGVPTIHLAIAAAPLSVDADRIAVITDPADALEQIADDTVAAVRAGQRRSG